LTEIATVNPGDAILDFGCGCGTNASSPGDARDRRAVSLSSTATCARSLSRAQRPANGLVSFKTVAAASAEELPANHFHVVLANPPYYAQSSIAGMFIEQSAASAPSWRPVLFGDQATGSGGPLVAEAFGVTEPVVRRGYTVLWR